MRAIIADVSSADVDLESFYPKTPDNFSVLVRLLVRPSDSDGEESFDVNVCTPAWLKDEVRRIGPIDGRHHLVVLAWEFHAIRDALARRFEREVGEDWAELAGRLARYGYWEFEDYRQ